MTDRNFFHFAGFFCTGSAAKLKETGTDTAKLVKIKALAKKSIQQALMRLQINMTRKQQKGVLFKTR